MLLGMGFEATYPAWLCQQFANLKMVIEIVSFPIQHGGSFHSKP